MPALCSSGARLPGACIEAVKACFHVRGRTMQTKSMLARKLAGAAIALGLVCAAAPGLAQPATAKIDAADTAWMISASGLVLMMTIPGLALFYCGMVRKKNVLATMAH